MRLIRARKGTDEGADYYSGGDVESLFTKNARIFRKGTDGSGCLTDCSVAAGGG